MPSKESTIKIRQTHHLKQDSPVCVTRRVNIENQANSPPETRQANIAVTRRMHIENQANSPPERRQATVCATSRVHIKNWANSLSVKEWPEHVSS